MRRLLTIVLLLIVLTLSVSGALAQGPTIQPSSPSLPATGQSAPNPVPEDVLWDQPVTAGYYAAIADQDFTDYPDYSSYVADDFVNGDSWTLRNIWFAGDMWNGGDTLLDADWLNWAIWPDAGGVPAGDPSGGGQPPTWSLSLLPTDPSVALTTGGYGYLSNAQLTLPSPVTLAPGHWWVAFWPTMSFGVGGQYGRVPSDTANGYVAQWINPGGGFGMGTGWQPWTNIDPSVSQDTAFRLSGSINKLYVSDIDMKYRTQSGRYVISGRIEVREQSGPVVEGAYVYARWRLPDGTTVQSQGLTDTRGHLTLKVKSLQTGKYKLCVVDITHPSFTYDPALNVETCDVITVP